MNRYFYTRSCTNQGYIHAIINAMENSITRMKYYNETNDAKFLEQSNEWLDVANIYMRQMEINNEEISV